MKIFSIPTSSAISTFAPSMVPSVSAPFNMNFILPVPDASLLAVEICSLTSAAAKIISALDTRVILDKYDLDLSVNRSIVVYHISHTVDELDR